MTVYIEYVLIDNFVIDYLMLKATFATTGKRYSKGRLFLCALFGAIIAILYPLLEVHSIILTAVKICSGLLIILLSNNYEKKKSFYIHAVLFFGYTFFTGGAIIGIFNLLGIPYSLEISIAIMVLPVYLVIRVILSIVKFIYRRKDVLTATVDVEISLFGKIIKGRGFFDTGNAVYDGENPVIFCGKQFVLPVLDGNLKGAKIKKLTVSTVNGEEKKTAFKLDEVKIYSGTIPNIYTNVTLCVVNNIGEGYDVILHPALLRSESDEIVREVKEVS